MNKWIYRLTDRHIKQGNAFLILNIILFISVSLLFTDYKIGRILAKILFNTLILSSLFTIKRNKNLLFSLGLITIVSGEILASIFAYKQLEYLAGTLKVIFFSIIVIKLVIQVIKSKNVNSKVIVESINVYLLIAIIGSIIAFVIMTANPEAFAFNTMEYKNLSDFLYYSVVTITTLGYGDIVPVSSAAKLLSMFLSVAGQLYITIILALLIGKFLANTDKN